jgi:aminoglycoside phosphotransferase (APT) family kinase protein
MDSTDLTGIQSKILQMFNEIYQETISAFFPSASLHALQPIGEGLINETFLIQLSNQENWILQRINTNLFQQPARLMNNFVEIATHLKNSNRYPLHIIQPQATSSGAYYYEDSAANCWRVFPFLPNTFAPTALPSPEQAYHAAHAYGLFFQALSDFPHSQLYLPLPGFHDTLSRYHAFRAVLENNPAHRLKHVVSEVQQILEAEHYAQKVQELVRSGIVPTRVTHNDTKAGNVLLHRIDGSAAAVIDWDTVMPGTVLSDYGDMVRTFVPDRLEDAPVHGISLRKEVWQALEEGFLKAAGTQLTQAEKDNLPLGAKWIVTEQALRFLTDYLDGDRYYKTNYPDHNLDRARNQLSLLRLLEQ